MNALERYRVASRLSFQSLADLIGTDKGRTHQWCKGARAIPPERVGRISAVTGIARWQLRPDLYEVPTPVVLADPVAAAFAAGLGQLAAIDLSDSELAMRLVVSARTVRLWRTGDRRMAASYARQFEKLFGIPRQLLRPDLFDPPPEASATGVAPQPASPALRGAA